MMMAFPALITMLAMVLYIATMIRVAQMRAKHKVAPPSITGPDEFLRTFRVQQNTLEALIVFVPSLWVFAYTLSFSGAAFLGMVWLIGRVLYALGYYREAKKRMVGFVIAMLTTVILVIGGLIGSILLLVASL